MDIIKQLYWESKRAPSYIWERTTCRQRRNLKVKLYGNKLKDRLIKMKETEQMYNEAKEDFEANKHKKLTGRNFPPGQNSH